jgi:hypothetical protein
VGRWGRSYLPLVELSIAKVLDRGLVVISEAIAPLLTSIVLGEGSKRADRHSIKTPSETRI